MKILITGGAGFIGQHLAKLLTTSGHTVTAFDTLSKQVHQDPAVSEGRFPGSLLRRDVSNENDWSNIPVPDAVVHLAAETGTAQSMYEQDHYQRINVHGTRLAAQAASRWQVPIVALSSRAVYGEGLLSTCHRDHLHGTPECLNTRLLASKESDPHAPLSTYGKTKSAGGLKLAEITSGNVPSTIIRPQNVIGHGQALHNPYTGVLAAFLARLKEARPLSIYGDGSQTRDFVHVEDLAKLISWSLDVQPSINSPRILNCGTGTRTTLNQLANYSMDAVPSPNQPLEHVNIQRAGDIEHACADLSRLRSEGAPLPLWNTRDSIADFIRGSWSENGPSSDIWDNALDDLTQRGLTK